MQRPAFIFTTCQIGAELALKRELTRRYPGFKPAFARPGFVTFKLPPNHNLMLDWRLDAVFARCWGYSLGPVEADPAALPEEVWRLAGDSTYQALHVFARDCQPARHHGYVPALGPDDLELDSQLKAARPELELHTFTRPGDLVLDVVRIDNGQYWLGYHQANTEAQTWPGGLCQIKPPEDMVSRAYLKIEEALRWSQLPVRPGERIVEIGAAPGGAAQALLARGLEVTGIDPAEIHPRVAADPNFTHIRKRGVDVRRREFRRFRYLAADMNVAPKYTLDTVEAIVTHPEVNIRGLILTLKLPDWRLAEQIPSYLFRIRTWGYQRLQARQLHHDHQEICVVAERMAK